MATTMITMHQVEDFKTWKQGFDAGAEMRNQAGLVVKEIYQSVDDANSVTIISEVESKDIALALMNSPQTQEAIKKSGVVSEPKLIFLNKAN